MERKTMFGISQEFLKIIQELEDNDGEFTDEINEQLAINREDFEEKSEKYYFAIKHMEAQINERKETIKRLQLENQATERSITGLKHNLAQALKLYHLQRDNTGKESYKTKLSNLSITLYAVNHKTIKLVEGFHNPNFGRYKVSTKFTADELEQINKRFNKNIVGTYEADNSNIIGAIENGHTIEGATLVDASYPVFKG